MSTSFFDASPLHDDVASPAGSVRKPGLFARFMASVVKAREAQAEREVNRYLARQPDRLLLDIGLDHRAIAELRYQHPY